jgi:hypothetical protein
MIERRGNMKHRMVAISAILATVSLGACGGHGESVNNPNPPPPPMSQQQILDTNGVLELAKKTSETSAPFAVNDGALQLTDTSETTDPVSLNGM